jgi:tRNA-dihydrouridine synthase B
MHLTPLTVGDVALDGSTALAPMSGVTDIGFRRIARRFGAPIVISEMVASDELAKGSAEALLRAEGQGITPHIVQLAGCEPEWMGRAARIAVDSGAAIIDINMGCPAKKVTGGYAGSALMRDLDHALRLIEATIAAVTVPVTVKMRLGWDHDSLNAPDLARRAEQAGVKLVTVHGRTRQQFYKGRADWDAIAAVKDAVSIPVIANGDCGNANDARAMLRQSRADGVMIGRATLGRPWLVGALDRALREGGKCRTPDALTCQAAALDHYDTLLSIYGHHVGLRHARKHLAAYADVWAAEGHLLPPGLRERIVTSEDTVEVTRLLAAIYTSEPVAVAA